MSTQPNLRRGISPQWWLNLNRVIKLQYESVFCKSSLIYNCRQRIIFSCLRLYCGLLKRYVLVANAVFNKIHKRMSKTVLCFISLSTKELCILTMPCTFVNFSNTKTLYSSRSLSTILRRKS